MRTRKTGQSGRRRRIALIVGIALAVTGVCGYTAISANAVYDAAKTVHMTDSEIGNSTLAIGTHLVYLGAMDEQVYEIAQRSANESGQKKVYYKSELSGGGWYDITDSSSLADISTAGTPVAASVVEQLNFNYYTKEDGLTYDLNSNKGICIFDIDDPYSLETMQEFETLKDQFQILKKKSGKSVSDKYTIKLLEAFYETKLTTNETGKVDEQIAGLQAYFNGLVSNSASLERRSVLHLVMAKADAGRRAMVYKKLSEVTVQTLIKNLQGLSTEDAPENYQPNPDITAAASSALAGLQESYMTCSNKMLSEGSTVLSSQEYSNARKLINAAVEGDQDACDGWLDKLCALYNIEDGRIVNEKKELQFIEDVLMDEADSAYVNKLGTGTGSEYKTAQTLGSSKSVLDRLLKKQQNAANSTRSELQYIIKAKVNRLENLKAQEFVKARIAQTGIFENSIKDDEYAPYAKESFEQYKSWLTTLLKNLVEKSPQGSDMEKLVKKKQELLLKKQEALDNNDLAAAKKLDAEIDAAVTDIEKMEKQLTKIIVSADSSESEKAVARANQGKGTAAADIEAVKENALDSLQDGDTAGVENALEGIAALMAGNKEAAVDALGEISDALEVAVITSEDGSKAEKALKSVKDLIAANADLLLSTLTESEVDTMLETRYGDDFDSLKPERQAAVLVAMSRYVDATGDEVTQNLLLTRAQRAYWRSNSYIYPKLESENDPFASVNALSRCSGFRYIYSDTQQKSILQKGGAYYSFSAFSTIVKRSAATDLMDSGETAGAEVSSTDDTLNNPAGFQRCIYIPAEYVKKQFGFTVEYLIHSDYSVLATDDILAEAEEVLTQLYTLAE